MGKSLFLDALNRYFDIGSKDQYENLFKGLKVFGYPSHFKSNMYVLKFDFSGLNVDSYAIFNESLKDYIKFRINKFIDRYPNLGLNKNDITNDDDAILSLEKFVCQMDKGCNLLILIDEYDCSINKFFGNHKEREHFKNEAKINAINFMNTFRRVFEKLKALRTENEKLYIFLTGVSPQALDDFTSGFNVGKDISLLRNYSEILGYPEEKVWEGLRLLMIPKEFQDKIFQKLKSDNNGYRYSYDINTKTVYNPTKINYCFKNFQNQIKIYHSDKLIMTDPDDFLDFIFNFPQINNNKPA